MEHLDLCGVWNMRWTGGEALPARIPGSLLSTLLDNRKIDDPFDRENEYPTAAWFERDYAFERTFDADEKLLAAACAEIVFEGLDTVADVYLNDQLILSACNMHRVWRVNVTGWLRKGENELRVLLHSPNRFVREASKNNPDVTYDGSGVGGTSFLRKAHCMFGWDWGPHLPDCGIWRPCYIEYRNEARITDVELIQTHLDKTVEVTARVAMDREDFSGAISGVMTAPDGKLIPGVFADGAVRFTVENPRLWQPNGWGDQPLYDVEITYAPPRGETPQVIRKRLGLRTLELSRAKDQWGEEFCFVINGNKLFSMGADYIPEDNILSRITPDRTRQLLESCKRAHFNCIRVWGGGYYPDDWFFDLCDEMGLVVWMDLMYACNVYKMTPEFEENIVAEARENLRRVRHHACMGLICGNNEMEMAWISWGGVKDHSEALRQDYVKQFEHVLKDVSEACAPYIPYWPSSPSSGGGFDDPNGFDRGDVHDWSVWHGLQPFESFQKKYPRFCSEFGFESFPSLKTVRSFTRPEDRNIFSRVMESHQKCGGGNGKIMYYLSQNLPCPQTLAHTVYASQLLQAEAIRFGVEHWRRNRGRCMGAIYWQLNDCWPVASWASIDSFGRWKGLHYAAARFFAPVSVSCQRTGWRADIHVTNDTLTAFTGTVVWQIIDAAGKVWLEKQTDITVPPLTSQKAAGVDASAFCDKTKFLHPEDHYALVMRLKDAEGHEVSRNCELFSPAKYFAFEPANIQTAVRQEGDDCVLELTSDRFAWYVCLDTKTHDCAFSDNWFFLLPGETKAVAVGGVSCEELKQELEILHVAQLMEARV